ncbi:hypothetical protein [Rhizobium sp. UGM030330-04]|uniref:hypothetical protein n=1 Tax=Pseudomonadota TaxID=1224 RepID=UPI000BD9C7AB|nr:MULTISPECIES: hypothetical protein [Pseudomonadota]PYG53443.1 hypothetical protein N434_04900 [Rhizobium sp. UGM030330-04]SNY78126.1 hypothetical protein SAMN02744784_04255 [Stenotrophomonas sp. CC120223-11]
MSDKPIKSFKDYPVEVAVWANQTSDDEPKTFYSVTVERTYKDGDEYKKTHGLNGRDCLKAAHLLGLAHEEIRQRDNAPRS